MLVVALVTWLFPIEVHLELMDGSSVGGGSNVAAVPRCLEWTVDEVADWMEGLGFGQYRVSLSHTHLYS